MSQAQLSVWPATDWDDAFANLAHIPDSDTRLHAMRADAAAYRAGPARMALGKPYGDDPDETLDLVFPDGGSPKGLAIFIHGGVWQSVGHTHWTHYAEGARANGWAVCMPGYSFAPDLRVSEITQQVGRAITAAAAHAPGPIRLAGHSTGGHLVTRMCCEDGPLEEAVWSRIAHVLSISGVHDLRPLVLTQMNADLALDPPEAEAESPVLHAPRLGTRFTAWVGGGERPEFLRQSAMLPLLWKGLSVPTSHVVDGAHNHLSVLDGLRKPDSPITRAFVG